MNLPLHQILPGEPVPLYAQNVDDSCSILASCRSLESSTSNAPSTLRIHSLYPLSKLRISERCPPNVKSVHPYGTSNLLFLILAGDNKRSKGKGREGDERRKDDTASYKVVLWDDKAEETMLELTFRDPVLNIVLRRDKLVVILERRVILFHLDLHNKDRGEAIVREGEYETVSNPLGLASIATTTGSTLLAFPGRQVGHVQLIRLPRLEASSQASRPAPRVNSRAISNSPPPYPIIHIFQAHSSPLRTLTLSRTGSLLCTSSNKGTLLRVFPTTGSNKSLIRELRRGTDQADIWSVAFLNPDKGEMIACASDKRTVHVWHVGDLTLPYSAAGASASRNTSTSLSGAKEKEPATKAFNLLKPYLPAYFSSQWSDLTWRIPHNASVTFQASHVAALAEQDDVATCFFVDSSKVPLKDDRKDQSRQKKMQENEAAKEDLFYLLVITKSGAWYKLAIPQSPASEPSAKTSISSTSTSRNRKVSIQDDRENIRPPSTVRKASINTSRNEKEAEEDAKKCRLVEYKRIGYGSDGDEEDEEDYDVHISESNSDSEEED
ncbi:hypothetical protein P389DRAFT_7826 [Cystobasidium minutum MCA 4210]|uniref:uncharacterized protein n=1 Tax=Cystobasidium minutum MCA 4210 TaxID=1397322 RepID=UPI0034CDB713|eukprot:jgi/Rhomi1/7826/CE7825_1585